MTHRVIGPRRARRNKIPGEAADPTLRPIADALAGEMGQDRETAERNAQNVALMLKRALKRRKAVRAGERKHPVGR